jgi:hypothetical protein
MAYDPTKPVEDSPLDAAEMRSQLSGLKTLIDQRVTNADMATYVTGHSAALPEVMPLLISISNPPTQYEVQQVLAKLNELITALERE